MSSGGVELERALDSITVGCRHRHDLGDLRELCASIERFGLLQPITITPDGTLLCGQRRLAAVRRLGFKRVKVWIDSSVSPGLEALLAEQQENALRKPLTPTEAATLYAELKRHYAADAARRQQASRFGANGGGNFPPPQDGSPVAGVRAGKAREQAARAITGRDSSRSLDRVVEVQRLAADPTASERVREIAREELAGMDADGKVNGHYETVAQAAREAILRVRSGGKAAGHSNGDGQRAAAVKRYGLRAFLQTVRQMDGWWRHYDAGELAEGLSEEQWQRVRANLEASNAFVAQIAAARDAKDGEHASR